MQGVTYSAKRKRVVGEICILLCIFVSFINFFLHPFNVGVLFCRVSSVFAIGECLIRTAVFVTREGRSWATQIFTSVPSSLSARVRKTWTNHL